MTDETTHPASSPSDPINADQHNTDQPNPTDSTESPPDADPGPEADNGAGDAPAKPAPKKRSRKKTSRKSARSASANPDANPDETPEADAQSNADSDADREGDTEARAPAKAPRKSPRASTRSGAKPATKAAGAERGPLVQMVVNYTPGDECRIAIVEDGKLEEYHAERADEVSRVNNIYLGRVTNVEPAIQAAFVDFGIGENGFLHISDLHPRYFQGTDEVEKVGKKTPRRDRPPIQEALRKGQQILVQVIKEGVGTKGPTLTSYLSIPGRYLVMMPQMDKVGVSRKVEDDESRRKMRDILDQLDLPEGFGFILRTAGMDRTKTELKRDLAYLQRLWKDIESRRTGAGGKPRLLYAESDLLVRILRDQLTSEIDQVVIDHPLALERAARFMKIVSPRAGAKIMRHAGEGPIFHAFGLEQQIMQMHSREVPLPSGGRLVIDETEALVAIDINSGRSRAARDAETNALETNLEAVDEICRQLRLRDLGGLVIHDLIDMRMLKNRKAVEQRFKDRLKRDRAKTTILPISAFGIMEMTRQRMRGSHERQHFIECPACRGRGMLQKPQSVAADALRELAALMSHERVAKAEMVVHPRIAGALLSVKRRTITRIERSTGKRVDVRVNEAIPPDRTSFYAYDETGADLAIDRLPRSRAEARVEPWAPEGEDEAWAADPAAEAEELLARDAEQADEELLAQERAEAEAMPMLGEEEPEDNEQPDGETGSKKKRKRRRRKRRKGEGESEDGAPGADTDPPAKGGSTRSDDPGRAADDDDEDEPASATPPSSKTLVDLDDDEDSANHDANRDDTTDSDDDGKPRKKRRRRRKRRKGDGPSNDIAQADSEAGARPANESSAQPDAHSKNAASNASNNQTGAPAGSRSNSKPGARASDHSRGRSPAQPHAPKQADAADATSSVEPKPELQPKPKRSLYGASRRKLSPSEANKPQRDR